MKYSVYALIASAIALTIAGCAGEEAFTEEHLPGGGNPTPPAIARLIGISPLQGVAYKPAPSNYNGDGTGLYFDSDFCNTDFRELWGPAGRDDLKKLKDVGVNFLHIYDWNQPGSGRDHRSFLDRCNN